MVLPTYWQDSMDMHLPVYRDRYLMAHYMASMSRKLQALAGTVFGAYYNQVKNREKAACLYEPAIEIVAH